MVVSSPTDVLETCWSAIEPFVELEGSVSVSATCRSLHRILVDADSRRMKVSHFSVDNTPISSSNDAVEKNWHTAPGRIPHFLSRALNAIHFPSLRSISIDFPAAKRRIATGHADVIDDAASSAFPIFVANLAYARNLELLNFNASRLMATERSGQLESLYEIFAENLSKCSNLRDLRVTNIGVERGRPDAVYSVALVRAMAEVIRNRRLGLEGLGMQIAGQPSDARYNTLLSSRGICAVTELVAAVLSAASLSELQLLFLGPGSWKHWNAFINATENRLSSSDGAMPHMKKLLLGYVVPDSELGQSEFQAQAEAAPVFDFFAKSHSLESLWLGLSKRCIQDKGTFASLRRLLENKPNLSNVAISCGDMSGDIVKFISEALASNIERKALSHLSLGNLRGVDEEDVSTLQKILRGAGLTCYAFNAKRNDDGTLDISTMTNVRPIGETTKDSFQHFLGEPKGANG